MNKILSEKAYQRFITDFLRDNNGYVVRTDENFDRYYAIDREMLFKFLEDTQPEAMATLRKTYKGNTEDTIVNFINNKILETSLIEVLKSEHLEISNTPIRLMYTKPATSINRDLMALYEKNIFSVAEEIWANDDERIDIVIFLNGFAIMSFELKCNAAGQNYENAIKQYRLDRDPKSRLFLFKAGCIVNFAMDLEEVHMTTKLAGNSTFFLPFNRGNGEGVHSGKGNPLNPDGFGVSYMWEDILRKDTVIELLHKFVFVERKEKTDPVTGKTKKSEAVIFPRYHQLDCLRKTLGDVRENHTSNNYLIQHSAGSGKTYTIAWLAHRLASLHDADDKIIYDNVIIITDRVVVDRQLQKAVQSIEHKSGLIKVMDDKCTSDDLRIALKGNTKIIATTIQKFLYIADIAKGLKDKNFAVIIDEAHSSTAGKDMAAVTKVLGSDEPEERVMEDVLVDEIKAHGKQSNVSMFAFTATPKPTTLQMFGRLNAKGQHEAFHLYSMKQAIEEGFILDVLQHFTPYQTFYQINKEIEADPKYANNKAKRQIARFAMFHDTNISQRIEIIIEHFRNTVMTELNGQAKGMVITGSRPEAVKYYNAFRAYCERKGYTDIAPLVAFSGKVTDKQIGNKGGNSEYSESSLNGFNEDHTPDKFDTDNYQVLLVANKYQTGFDQPKLCAMYVLKKLNGVNAVQTLSRLNRVCPPFDKKTFILDFVNSIDDMVKAFEPYYTTTLLCNTATPEYVYELESKVDGYLLFSENDVDEANTFFYDEKMSANKKETNITFLLSKAKKEFEKMDELKRRECLSTIRRFVRFYEFLLQVSSFSDLQLHKKYNFIIWLLPYLKIGSTGKGFDLSSKIQASNFYQKKGKEQKADIKSKPPVKLPTADPIVLTEDEEKKLSDIIKEVNAKTGKSFDNDVAVKAALQIRDLMKKNDELKASAKSNTVKDFAFAYFDNIDDALLEGRSQNQDFFDLLLKNPQIRDDVLGIFLEEIYNSLKKED